MEVNESFYAWVPRYARYVILILMTFIALCANGVYLGITTNMYSDLGVYAEPYTMATNAMYIGMGGGFLFVGRLAVRFSAKTGVIIGFTMMLLMNLICATTSSPILTIAASLVLGFTKILAVGVVYLEWLMILGKKSDASTVYPFFYFIALAGLYFITWLTTYFTYLYSWRYAYIVIFVLIIFCIVLAAVFFENHELKKKIPLYQLDIPGLLLLITSLMFINYVAVYGKVEDWFNSVAISTASFGAAITMLLFIKRETTLKRPILDLNLFKLSNINAGLFLFLILGVITPGTFQSALSGNVLHFELIRNAQLNLFLIPGIVAGCILSFFWYKKNYDSHLLIIIGFSAFVIYHIMMYSRFVNDLSMADFSIPSLFRGFGLAILYISIGLYTVGNLPIPSVLKTVGLILIVRQLFGAGIMSGLYNYLLYADTNRHLSTLASQIDANEPMVMQRGNLAEYAKFILQQANLSALKEISGTIIIFGLAVVMLLIGVMIYRKIRKGVFATA